MPVENGGRGLGGVGRHKATGERSLTPSRRGKLKELGILVCDREDLKGGGLNVIKADGLGRDNLRGCTTGS